MSTYYEMQNRYNRLQDNILKLDRSVAVFGKDFRSTEASVKHVEKMKNEAGSLENRVKDLEDAAATFDREFLERKTTSFHPDKLATIQDFTLFFFFISYCILITAIAITTGQIVKICLGGFVGLLLLVIIVFRYG